MKISSEAKVGLIGIATILVLIWGINYLKGRNILSKTYTLYSFYPESGGLESSAPVLLNGVKIGFVDQVVLQTKETPPIKVVIDIEKKYTIARGSSAELFSADLVGSKAIRIIPSGKDQLLKDQDSITATVAPDLLASLQSRIFPILDQIGHLAASLDTLSRRFDTLINQDALGETLDHLASITESLNSSLNQGGTLDNSFRHLESFTSLLAGQKEEMASLIRNLNSISENLDSAGLDRLAIELQHVSSQFNTLLTQVNSGEGNAGKFFYSDSLYENLDALIADLDTLVKDLHENPQDYVQISVFGRTKKEKR
ncbi:MAG: MCE family protein [Bacteroidales bacterium]|nr:MCE family protein [Bacteroidales bacterium]